MTMTNPPPPNDATEERTNHPNGEVNIPNGVKSEANGVPNGIPKESSPDSHPPDSSLPTETKPAEAQEEGVELKETLLSKLTPEQRKTLEAFREGILKEFPELGPDGVGDVNSPGLDDATLMSVFPHTEFRSFSRSFIWR